MTILERHNRTTQRKVSYRTRSKLKPKTLSASTRALAVGRRFRKMKDNLDRRFSPPVVLDAIALQWLQLHMERDVLPHQNPISLFRLANSLVGCKDWLTVYGGEDPSRKKAMINVLNRLQRLSGAEMEWITNFEEALEALGREMTIDRTAEMEEEQEQQRPVLDYMRLLEQTEFDSRHAQFESQSQWKKILVPSPGKDYEKEDEQLLEQMEPAPLQDEEPEEDAIRPLSQEQQEELYDMIRNGPEIVAKLGEDTVQRRSLETLSPGQWLNDEVIHFYLQLLSCPGQHFFKSFFVTKLRNEGDMHRDGVYEYRNVKRWSKKVEGKDIFKLDKVFFPVNQGNAHWTLAVACVQERRLQYYDSMGGSGMKYLQDLERYFQDEHKDKKKTDDDRSWTLVPCARDTPLQRNGFDCGVFVCVFCEFLSRNRPLTFTQDDVTVCRERIAYSILHGKVLE